MRLARVTGSVTATAKDPQLVGLKLLICDLVDARDNSDETGVVAVDTVGAGEGDQVLIVFGTAARMLSGSANTPVDAAISAIVDRVNKTGKR